MNVLADQELLELAALAQVTLTLGAACMYGLVSGGPEVNYERCEEILERAQLRGLKPHEDLVDRVLTEVVTELARPKLATSDQAVGA